MSNKSRPAHGLTRGQTVTARISSIAPGGEGVSRDHGPPIFVHRVAPGDLAEIELFDVRKDFARGRLVKLIESSPQRVEPPCKLFKVCGGCQLQHLDYPWQLKCKEEIVRQAVKHIAGLDPDLVKPTIPAPLPLYYRNKVQFPVANPAGSDRILAGYYQQDSHDLVNIKHCPVQPEPLDRMLTAVKEVCQTWGMTAYQEDTGKGLLRHITARYSFESDQILVTLVINAEPGRFEEQPLRDAAQDIMQVVPEIAGVCLNYNSRPGNRILGDTTRLLAGQDSLQEKLKSNHLDAAEALRDGLIFRVSATSFFQVNPAQAATLLDVVLDVVRKPVDLLVDAYAGVGTFAMWLSFVCKSVIAIEEHPAAVQDGQGNLELNRIGNVSFRDGSVEAVLAELSAEKLKPEVVLLDPPRKGVSPTALQNVINLSPPTVVYVSCNPATLARDLKILEINGYKTRDIQPIDMFPQTYHVESVTVLEKKSP